MQVAHDGRRDLLGIERESCLLLQRHVVARAATNAALRRGTCLDVDRVVYLINKSVNVVVY